jgi:hypothetical protein
LIVEDADGERELLVGEVARVRLDEAAAQGAAGADSDLRGVTQ